MSKKRERITSNGQMSFALGGPALTSLSLEGVREYLESEADSSSKRLALLQRLGRKFLLPKMSLGFLVPGLLSNHRRSKYQLVTSIQKKKLKDGRVVYRASANWKRVAILRESSLNFQNSVTGFRSEFLTLNSTQWAKDGSACSLSEHLENERDWIARNPGKTISDWIAYISKFFLTKQAAIGILRRAEKRGREFPRYLKSALERIAGVEKDAE